LKEIGNGRRAYAISPYRAAKSINNNNSLGIASNDICGYGVHKHIYIMMVRERDCDNIAHLGELSN
jgi:hypothetical protein